MTYQELVKKIKSTNWYKQGGELSFFYTFSPYICVSKTLGYDNSILTQKGKVNVAYFNKDEENRKVQWVVESVVKNKSFIDQHITEWRSLTKKLLDFCNRKYQKSLNQWTDEELVANLNYIAGLSLECWVKGVLIEWFDPEGDRILRETMRKYSVELTDEEILILTALRN